MLRQTSCYHLPKLKTKSTSTSICFGVEHAAKQNIKQPFGWSNILVNVRPGILYSANSGPMLYTAHSSMCACPWWMHAASWTYWFPTLPKKGVGGTMALAHSVTKSFFAKLARPSVFRSSEQESSFRVSGNHCAAHTAHHLKQLDISHPNTSRNIKQKPRPTTAMPFHL